MRKTTIVILAALAAILRPYPAAATPICYVTLEDGRTINLTSLCWLGKLQSDLDKLASQEQAIVDKVASDYADRYCIAIAAKKTPTYADYQARRAVDLKHGDWTPTQRSKYWPAARKRAISEFCDQL